MPKKRETTLQDLDEKTIGFIDKLVQEKTRIPELPQKEDSLLCQFCKERLIKVSPEIRLENMVLFECVSCKERCYKDR